MKSETASSSMEIPSTMSKCLQHTFEKCDFCNEQKPTTLNEENPIGCQKGCIDSLENKEKFKEAQEKYIVRLERYKEYNREYRNRPENKEKQKKYMKAYTVRPENKKKHREAQIRYKARINAMKKFQKSSQSYYMYPKVKEEEL